MLGQGRGEMSVSAKHGFRSDDRFIVPGCPVSDGKMRGDGRREVVRRGRNPDPSDNGRAHGVIFVNFSAVMVVVPGSMLRKHPYG